MSLQWCRCPLLLVMCFLFFSTAASGQQLSVRGFGQLDGLNNLELNALVQDRAGYLWAGTSNGLYRFDGNRFRRIGEELDSATSIMALHVDPVGRLWVGTDLGLLVLEGEQLRPVLRIDGKPFAVKIGQHFASIDADHLLVQSNGRLEQVEPDGKGGWHGVPLFSKERTIEQPELADLAGILLDPDGTLWMGCRTSLCRYRDGKLTVLGAADGLPTQRWRGLLRDATGALWVGSSMRLMVLASEDQKFDDRGPDHFGTVETSGAVPLLQDRDGHLITASDNGVFRFNGDRWERYGKEHGLPIGSQPLLLDRDGDLWLGMSGRGLIQWQGYRHWENWGVGQGLPSDDVWSLVRTRDGRLYVGTGHGLATWHGAGFAAARGSVASIKAWGALAEDENGDLWAGSFSGTLIRRDQRSGRSRVMAELPGLIIYQLLFDATGQLWICTDRGLYLIADPQQMPTPKRVEATVALLGPDAAFPTACRDGGNHLWFAGAQGLLRLADGRWSRPPMPRKDHVFDHLACDGNTLWLSESHGTRLWRADTAAPQLQLRRLQGDVLKGRAILSMLVDRRHWLWLGTDRGLMLSNGHSWRLFNQQSGMIWNDSNQSALYEDRDGSIWVGTSMGTSHLQRPEALFESRIIPLQLVSARYGDTVLHGSTVPWSGGALDVHLAVPLYQNHEALSFRYRLLGEEDAWSTSNSGELRYAALTPGKYRLQVVAEHSSLQASSAMLELPLTVHPPWWSTGWAYASYALLALLVIGVLHRYRVGRVLQQRALLERRVAERTAELEASREEHRLRSLKDGLTQAWNRVALMERLALMLTPGTPPFLLVLMDLDHFKRINDTHGHLAGDEVLREMVRRMQAQLRASDTVGRYGGEEFMLLMPGLDLVSGMPRLEQLHRAIGTAPVIIDGTGQLPVTCSCGVVTGHSGLNLTPEQWIGLADQALYQAKALGRNRIEHAVDAEALGCPLSLL